MGELQKLWVTLGLKSTEFTDGMKGAEDEVKGFSSRISSGLGNALGSLKTVTMGAFLGVGAAAVGGFGMAMKSAIDMNASLEQSTMQFTTLMGDADKASQHVKDLFEFGAKTPFETEPIITASKHLQVFGGEALNSMDNLTLIGDAAAAVGAPIDEVSFWVGRMYAALQAGQPFGEAAARLQEMGIMGPEVRAQLEGMQKDGAAASDIFGAFQGQLGSFTGAMEMQSQSWTGLMSTLTDTLSMAAANGLAPFFDIAKSALGGLVEFLNGEAIQGAINGFATTISTLGSYFSIVISDGDALNDYLADLPVSLKEPIRIIGEIVAAILELIEGLRSGEDPVGDFANLFWTLADTFGATTEQATAIFNAVRTVGDGFLEFITPIWNAAKELVSFKDVLIVLSGVIIATVVPAIISVVTAAAPVLLVFGALVLGVALIRKAWEEDFGGIQEKVKAVLTFISNLISTFLSAVTAWWKENGEEVMEQTQIVWNQVKELVSAVLTFVQNTVSNFVAAVKTFWTEHADTIMTVARNLWDIVSAIFSTAFDNLKLLLTAFTALFKGDFETFGDSLVQIWQNILDLIVLALTKLWDSVVVVLTDFYNSIKTWFQTIDWGQLGRDIIDGIVWAIELTGTKIRDKLMDMAKAAWDAVAEFFKLGSPSRLMYYAGEMIVQGLINGIEENRDKVLSPVEQMVSDINNLLKFGADFSGMGSGFATRLKTRVMDPIKEQIAEVTSLAADEQAGVSHWFRQFWMGTIDLSDVKNTATTITRLKAALTMAQNRGDMFAQRDLAAALELMQKRNALQEEYQRGEQQLLELERKRQDMEFLKTQYELLKMISDNRNILPRNILEGLDFGLNADAGKLMDTMADIMGRIVAETNMRLQIYSPSRVFMGIGRRVMEGMAVGLQKGEGTVEAALEKGMRPLLNAPTQRLELYSTGRPNGNRTVVNGGYNVYVYGSGEPSLEDLAVLAR